MLVSVSKIQERSPTEEWAEERGQRELHLKDGGLSNEHQLSYVVEEKLYQFSPNFTTGQLDQYGLTNVINANRSHQNGYYSQVVI